VLAMTWLAIAVASSGCPHCSSANAYNPRYYR